MSSFEPDDATPPEQPDGSPPPSTPTWRDYEIHATDFTVPFEHPVNGYRPNGHAHFADPDTDAQTDSIDYIADDPADYPAQQSPNDVPAGAGLVPPRADAVPPTPTPAAQMPAPPMPLPHMPPPPMPPPPMPGQYPGSPPIATPWTHPTTSGQPGRARAVPPDPHAAPFTPVAPLPTTGHPVPIGPAALIGTPVPVPRPEDLLVPDRPEIAATPARWGWRGRVNRLSGGMIKPQPTAPELAQRKAALDIQRGFSRPMTVVVVQPKGGAGKTPTTIGLASALGVHRGGYVVGWDDNETRGTLAVRVANRDSQRTTVWDLLGALPSFERADARVGDLGYFVRSQGEAHFDALVSDDHPGNMAQIGENEFRRIHGVLQRFYRVIVIDTGNNVRSPNWQAAVNAADVVVVVSTYQRDVGYSGSWVLDHLMQTGRETLGRHAVTVLTAADPTTEKKVRGELLRHFGTRTRGVVEIPYDPHIALGGPIHWQHLREETRRAWTKAGAIVVNALAERDRTPGG